MKRVLISCIIFFASCQSSSENTNFLKSELVQLSNPVLNVDSLIFKQSATVELGLGISGVDLLYKCDDSEYKKINAPIRIDNSCQFHYKASKEGYLESETTKIQLIKTSGKTQLAHIISNPKASPSYPGNGASSLNDLKKGNTQFRNGNYWCGYQEEKIEFTLTFAEAQNFSKVYLSVLVDQGAWIFQANKMTVAIDEQWVGEISFEDTSIEGSAQLKFQELNFETIKGQTLKLIVENLESIQDWHPGKGNLPWIFIDEIIVE